MKTLTNSLLWMVLAVCLIFFNGFMIVWNVRVGHWGWVVVESLSILALLWVARGAYKSALFYEVMIACKIFEHDKEIEKQKVK